MWVLSRAWLLLLAVWIVLIGVAVALEKNRKPPHWVVGPIRTLTFALLGSGILLVIRWRQARRQPPGSN